MNEGLVDLIEQGFNLNAHVRIYTKELIEAELKISGFKILKYKFLYAFHELYKLKSFINRIFKINKTPNNLVILAQKI